MSFHINPETGEPKRCVARKGNCRYGADANHYEDKNSARQAFEKSQSIEHTLSSLKIGPPPPPPPPAPLPEDTFREVSDFRDSAIKSGNVKDEITATYSMMAKSFIKEYPSAASVEVLINGNGERYYMNVYDENGSRVGHQVIWTEPHPDDAENAPTRLLSNLYGDGYDDYRGDDFYEELGDSMSAADNMFRDKEGKDWHKNLAPLQHDRWDLKAAAEWSPIS